jgi:S-disulfanyl-L-cysteine oxidoreductase SoxD
MAPSYARWGANEVWTGDVMTRWGCALVAAVVLAMAPLTRIDAQQARARTLTDADMAQIKELSMSYGRALGMCQSEDYVALYAEPDGYFASGPRGRVAGRERLMELLKSEPFCHDNSPKTPRNLPSKFEIEVTAEGAKARVELAPTPGHYEDTYVKTSKGWRFKSHVYISTAEKAAGMTAADFEEIRKLGGNDTGQFQDVWADFPDGKRYRSSGLSIFPAKEGGGATGRGLLAGDAGRYEDEYVRTPAGWRFKSRKFSPPGAATASTGGSPAPAAVASAEVPKIWTGVYSAAQATRGEAVYESTCTTCHGFDLEGLAGRGPALAGAPFLANWESESVSSLFARLKTTMPRNNPGSLTDDVYLDLLTYLLQVNTYPQGTGELKAPSLADLHLVKRDGTSRKNVPNFAMVAMVGCLAQTGNRWVLTHTTEPLAARNEPPSGAEVHAASANPITGDTFRLMSAQGFNPTRHQGHQVYVKGLVYRAPDDSRLNVTALQSLSPRCQETR